MDAATERSLPAWIGRYEILRLLGRGAMGRVLLARDPVLDRSVAVKLLRDDLRLLPEQLEALIDRMRQEARASARVAHPNIVALFDMGEDPELGLYLVFEYADGVTLKQRLLGGPLETSLAAQLARETGDALSTAHKSGVLHRDIKPENLILTATGSKIADFGIARVPDSTLTRDGGLLGTPAYSAPESIAKGLFSPASDQFSMAATLYEAISQCRAFPGDDAVTVASRIGTDEAPPIARSCGLSPQVDQVLARGMSKDPNQRFATARDFGTALADALELKPRSTLATLPDARHAVTFPAEPMEQRPGRFLLGGAAIGVLLGAGAMHLTSKRLSTPKAEPAVVIETPAPAPSARVAWLLPSPKPRLKPPPSPRPSALQEVDLARLADAGNIEQTAIDAGTSESPLRDPSNDAGASPEIEP
jgi:serine/threonine-protein kinase